MMPWAAKAFTNHETYETNQTANVILTSLTLKSLIKFAHYTEHQEISLFTF